MVLLKEKPRTIGTDSDNSIYKDIEQSKKPPSDKNEIFIDQINNDLITEYDSHGDVKRDLKARHVAMIGIGRYV